MSSIHRRLDRLEGVAPPACPDPFHVTWHTVVADLETGELPPRPCCAVCGMEAENVIEIVYTKDWRPLNAADDTPMGRTTIKW